MNKLEAIAAAKTFRKDADELLQRMKVHKALLIQRGPESSQLLTREQAAALPEPINDLGEVIAQHTISIRDLESCIMRQGLVLKNIGTPDPYPESRNPESPAVEPTADGLKL